jgi:DUF2971 family protein
MRAWAGMFHDWLKRRAGSRPGGPGPILRAPMLPGRLYKYLSSERVDVLQHRLLRYTQPADLNDPAEGTIRIFAAAVLKGSFPPPLLPAMEDALNGLRENQRRFFNAQVGILSLTEVPDDTLMWSHYAARHSGFAMAFDTSDSHFHSQQSKPEPWARLRPVTYGAPRLLELDSPISGFALLAEVSRSAKAALGEGDSDRAPAGELSKWLWQSLYFTKGIDWSYEREWRIIERVECASKTVARNPYPICLFEFPPSALCEVVFGARMPQEARDAVLETLRQPTLHHVRVRTAVLDDRSGRINLVDPPRGDR